MYHNTLAVYHNTIAIHEQYIAILFFPCRTSKFNHQSPVPNKLGRPTQFFLYLFNIGFDHMIKYNLVKLSRH